MDGINTAQIKELNRELVRRALKERDGATKDELARETGLSPGTCRTILIELCDTGEAREIDLADSTGGRRSRLFIYNPNHAYIALLYPRMEGEKKTLYSTVLNMAGEKSYESFENYDEIDLEVIDREIERMIATVPSLGVLALGIPGVVQNGITGLCDFEKLSHLPLAEFLEERWKKPVLVENDVNCAALGYGHHQKNGKAESLAYLYYPREGKAGAGIVINGRVIHGASDFAGEVSHLPQVIDRSLQGSAQKNAIVFRELVVNTILSINCVINPETVVLTGEPFDRESRTGVEQMLRHAAPPEHCPRLIFEEDIHFCYIRGLQFMALQKLSCGFEVVRRVYS
jgi:hypothetical protein